MASSKTSPRSSQSRQTGDSTPSTRARFLQPVVIKQGSIFLLCQDDGDVRAGSDQGLYFHDMRYLSAQTLRLNGMPAVSLLADASEGCVGLFELTNPDLQDQAGAVNVKKDALGIRREKRLGDQFVETIAIQNYATEAAEFTVEIDYHADFADMFVVRGMQHGKRGKLRRPNWRGTELRFGYDGADGHERTTSLQFSHKPDEQHEGRVAYHLSLQSQERWELTVTCALRDESGSALESTPNQHEASQPEDRQRARLGALGRGTRVETDNPSFNKILARSFMDLHMLRMRQRDQTFFAAGVPWFVALFGRDTLVTSLEVAAFEPNIGADTLRILATFQGARIDDFQDEQPGKIPHEFRVGEMANLGEIPQTPYYGSVDSTPLFLILLGLHASWTGKLDVFHELRDTVDRALAWIEEYGDSDGDGFIDYKTHSSKGGRNQGWKDSGNAIVMEDATLAEPPIAVPEVQGEVYLAWLSMADLFARDGDEARASVLRDKARRLYDAFNDRFWLTGERYYALCREANGRFSKSVASNPAHALWTGIVDPKRAPAVVERAMQPDMFTGWGIRTLSAKDKSYNPVDYQVGSVWPHDNAIIVAGMHRYGFGDEGCQVFTALMQAAAEFEHLRLPEVFAGYDRSQASKPIKYPVACNPQAWASGSIPFMLTSALGLHPDGFNRRLEIETSPPARLAPVGKSRGTACWRRHRRPPLRAFRAGHTRDRGAQAGQHRGRGRLLRPYEGHDIRGPLAIKRAYEPPDSGDGRRVLVDRLWPRGVSKARLQLDAWVRDLAPSTELRKWFNHDPGRWDEFVRRYREELRAPEREALLSTLSDHARHGPVTLIYGARDTERNEAAVLRDVVQERLRDDPR